MAAKFIGIIVQFRTAGRVMHSLLDNGSQSTIYTEDEIWNLILCLEAQYSSCLVLTIYAHAAVMKNPANLSKHQSNPKVAPVIAKMFSKFGGGAAM